MGVGLALVLVAGCTSRQDPAEPDLPAAVAASESSTLAVFDLAADSLRLAVHADSMRPAPGMAAFVTALAAHDLPAEARAALRPASALRMRRLPGLEPERAVEAASLDALLDAALRGDRIAADEALAVVGRRATEAVAPDAVEPPVPLGGLQLAWAPAARGGEAAPDAQAAAFLALPPAARRDSAFFRDRAFLKSTAYRSAETLRLERGGLGLSGERLAALARASTPRASAAGLARWLAAHPSLLDRLAGLGGTPPRTATGRLGGLGAAVALSDDGDRLGVVLWDATLGVADPAAALSGLLRP